MVTIYSNQKINWNAKGNERILQNVVNLLNTYRYEIAYDRILGRDPNNIDKPLVQTRDNLVAETYELIQTYEPRAKIKNVEIIQGEDGPIIKAVVDIE